jgi:hypothetical protein
MLVLLVAVGTGLAASPNATATAGTATAPPAPLVGPTLILPLGPGPCATPITKANVGLLIDPEIPDWMRKEVSVLILAMVERNGCFRGLIAGGDKDGRFITNSIATLREHQRETARSWHRLNARSWISPAGDVVPMEDSPTPRALLGHWTCTGEYSVGGASYYFGLNHRGRRFSGRIEDFIYQYDVASSELYLGYGHQQGMAQHVTLGDKEMAMKIWGYYHDWHWTPMPTQPQLRCGKTHSGTTGASSYGRL